MTISKDNVLKYLTDTKSFFVTYHNHKETGAWAGIALFVPLLALMANLTDKVYPSTSDVCQVNFWKLGATVAIVLFAALVLFYVRKQFELRKFAGNVNAACFRLSLEYLKINESDIDENLFNLVNDTDEEIQAKYYLPKFLLDEVDIVKSMGTKAQKTLENIGYYLIGLASMSAIILIWLR